MAHIVSLRIHMQKVNIISTQFLFEKKDINMA